MTLLNHPTGIHWHPRDLGHTKKRRSLHTIGTHLFGSEASHPLFAGQLASSRSSPHKREDKVACSLTSVDTKFSGNLWLASRSELKPFKWSYADPVHEVAPLATVLSGSEKTSPHINCYAARDLVDVVAGSDHVVRLTVQPLRRCHRGPHGARFHGALFRAPQHAT